ncbi:MAG: nucleoside monophosphate kinase [Minisyncoccia bacterium]
MQTHTIIFIGPQGSGKGTQIALLSKVLKEKFPTERVVDIQTGRRFRALAAKGEGFTEEHIQRTLDTGKLQPLFLSVVLWGDAFHHHVDQTCHLLIDGFPRTVNEAKVLEGAFDFYERKYVTIINLVTSEEIVRERMIDRARADDTPESIEARLAWYREETLPVLAYYREREHTTMIECDGTKSIPEVHEQILKALQLI